MKTFEDHLTKIISYELDFCLNTLNNFHSKYKLPKEKLLFKKLKGKNRLAKLGSAKPDLTKLGLSKPDLLKSYLATWLNENRFIKFRFSETWVIETRLSKSGLAKPGTLKPDLLKSSLAQPFLTMVSGLKRPGSSKYDCQNPV